MINNNFIALAIHISIVISSFILFNYAGIQVSILPIVAVSFIHILSAFFFMKPANKYSYISVLLVFAVLLLLFIIGLFGDSEFSFWLYGMANPIYVQFIIDKAFVHFKIYLFVSAVIPPLLMYIGLWLKAVYVKLHS